VFGHYCCLLLVGAMEQSLVDDIIVRLLDAKESRSAEPTAEMELL
jgi:hypothetical protein